MDKFFSRLQHSNVYTWTSVIFLLFIEIYFLIAFNFVDIFMFSMIKEPVLQIFLQTIANLLIFSVSFTSIYIVVNLIYEKHWIRKNKEAWIQGDWLHIHQKDELRVGLVSISQNFEFIQVCGHNIPPANMYKWRETEWKYDFGRIEIPKSNSSIYKSSHIVGYYRAGQMGVSKKTGIHLLEVSSTSNRFPKQMQGFFSDNIPEDNSFINDKFGKLYLFKIDKSTQKLINEVYTDFNIKDIAFLHEKEQFKDLPYSKKLQELIEEYTKEKTKA
ncbi:MAG: hypothetical protein K6G85_04000 [Eubacterium sp.]|nr:hypothetical protein [Eubacterium sp.]